MPDGVAGAVDARELSERSGEVTVESLAAFAETFADLGDEEVRARAWR